jgi:hypothetical protein
MHDRGLPLSERRGATMVALDHGVDVSVVQGRDGPKAAATTAPSPSSSPIDAAGI